MEDASLAPIPELERIGDPERAGPLLHALRLRLVALAAEPASASELARRLGLPRQRVNYHVRELARAGFLKPAGRARKRNLIEQKYVATARAFVLLPEILGPAAADWRRIEDTASADYLLALFEQVRSDVAQSGAGEELPTFSVKAQFRFRSAGERAAFAAALRQAVVDVVARHSSPNRLEDGRPGRGRAYRLVLACYPAPAEAD